VVYHASYLRFLERARTEWLRAMGYGQDALRAGEGVVFVVRAMRLEFLRPARLDDELTVTVALGERRRASLVMSQIIRRGETSLLEAEVKVACVAAADFRPRAVPEALVAKMTPIDPERIHVQRPDQSPPPLPSPAGAREGNQSALKHV
jgi:acyl-CoA thioester hydrolase